MVDKNDVKDMFKNFKRTKGPSKYVLSKDEEHILLAETGDVVCSVDDYVAFLRKKKHCDFVELYHDETTQILRCKECGAIVFNNGDKKMKCPVCGKYHTDCTFWRKEDMNREKRAYLDSIINGKSSEHFVQRIIKKLKKG